MDFDDVERVSGRHVVAMPYPGRGHINPMMNLCELLASRSDDILITFVVTEEWLGFIGSDPKPSNFRFRSIPNVIPSELVRAADYPGFIEATMTKMEAPLEQLLDELDPPASTIIFDTILFWMVGVGNRRNIPVASFWIMSATVFSIYHNFNLLVQNRDFPINLAERGDQRVDYIPGVSSTRLVDLPSGLHGSNHQLLIKVMHCFSVFSGVQHLVLATVSELESRVIDALKLEFPIPIYSVGPSIPYFKLKHTSSTNIQNDYYFQWLDNQPTNSVLYISMGSFLSFSGPQMDEIAAGLRQSGVRYLWVARDETSRLKDVCGDMGIVVPWCDQLRVLSHSSVGGFWTHCGWNSTLEGIFAGVPFLTLPVSLDQPTVSKLIVEDWKIGWKVKKDFGENVLVHRDDIAELVQRFMDFESGEGKKMRRRTKELQQICQQAIAEGGSSEANINAFIRDLSLNNHQ